MGGLLEVAVLGIAVIVFFGPVLVHVLRRRPPTEVNDDFEPSVTVITPMFNEGESIRTTIRSILAQDYPAAKLELIVVDDCSTDDSFQHARAETGVAGPGAPRARVLRNPVNMGKRRSINRAVRESDSEIIVSVDSDVIIEKDAVRQLIRRFTNPRIAAVGGRVDILNKRTNWLTRMQAVKYYFGYQFLKSLERSFHKVMCLSGCLTAYRRTVLVELEPTLEERNILGVPIKYGEDRFLTRQIIKSGYETTMTMAAVCRTVAPDTLDGYFAQQLRWRRSNLVDYFGGLSHVWKLHSVVAVHYYAAFALFLAYPALLLHSLITGTFFYLISAHLTVAGGMGLLYWFRVRHLPADERVSPASFLPVALVAPVSYAILTPLALLTLDSGKWETRGHEDTGNPETPAPEHGPATPGSPVIVGAHARHGLGELGGAGLAAPAPVATAYAHVGGSAPGGATPRGGNLALIQPSGSRRRRRRTRPSFRHSVPAAARKRKAARRPALATSDSVAVPLNRNAI